MAPLLEEREVGLADSRRPSRDQSRNWTVRSALARQSSRGRPRGRHQAGRRPGPERRDPPAQPGRRSPLSDRRSPQPDTASGASGSGAGRRRRARPGGGAWRPGSEYGSSRARRGSGDNAIRGGVTGQNVERFAAPDSEPAPLADGEVVMSVVLSEPAARAIDHLTRPILEPGVAAKGTRASPGRRGSRGPGSRHGRQPRGRRRRRAPGPAAW